MDTQLQKAPCLLVEWARRDGKEHHRTDDCGENVRRQATRCLFLLFPGLRGPEQPPTHLQLARTYPEFRSIFVPLVRSDPEILHESLYGQMNKLIVQPIMKSGISTVIVIDALDKCKDEDRQPASVILSVLGQFVTETPMVKFFVTGHPEPRIREGFRLPLLAKSTDVFVLHKVKQDQVNSDIRSVPWQELCEGYRSRGN